MKEPNDEELQQWLEQQLKEDKNRELTTDDDDAALYHVLFSALADEPTIGPANNLADNVIKQIKAADEKAELWQYYLVIAGVLAAGAAGGYFAVSYMSPELLKPLLGFADAYKWTIVFIILSISIIEVSDKALMKKAGTRPGWR